MVDFLNNPIAEFNELRIAATNLVTAKTAEYSETVLTYVSNHSSELLYGSLSVFAAVTLIYLLAQWFEASCECDNYKWKFEAARFDAEKYESLYHSESDGHTSTQAELKDLEQEVRNLVRDNNQLKSLMNTLREERDAFEADLEEVRDDCDSFESNAEFWEKQCVDARNERDELEYERDNIEAERDVLLERIELLQEMTNTYKELVAEIETPQLRLAA